jgi:ATPase family associated with various cellular activities (AAA)
MAEASNTSSWSDMNHAHLVAEFARLKNLLGLMTEEPQAPVNKTANGVGKTSDPPAAIDRLVELFGLSPFERDLLLLCAGVEMDSSLAARCAEVHGQAQRPFVTFGLAMATLTDPHWSAFAPSRPLRRFHLVDVGTNPGLASAPVCIDERVLHYLAGINLIDPSLEPLLTATPWPHLVAEEHHSIAHSSAQVLRDYSQYSPIIHLCGNDPHGQEDVAALAAHDLGRHMFTLRVEDLPSAAPELERLVILLERESVLLPAALLIQCGTSGLTQPASHLLERLPVSVFLGSQEPVRLRQAFVRFEVNKPDAGEQRTLWQKTLGDGAEQIDATLDVLSQHFRLSARTIFNTGSLAASKDGEIDAEALWDACRSLARPKLEDLAQRIVPCAGWDDLVLPDLQMQVLRHLAAQVWHRMKVHETWGFATKGARGLGVSALFCGDSGTGKTLAAEVLARELGLDLYRIDLASVVSKYIGETEKNLKQVFDAAEEGGVLLLFDEADALFGKRGDVKDSHDRYANIEVGYLLQRMESYQGLAILTTNLKSSLDRAFQRRLRFTVTFPFPDATHREKIWSKVFPTATPTRGLNLKKLSQLNVPGGNIRNIALNAAFLAANGGTAVEMGHLMEAARLEAHKIERPLAEAELRGWV